MQVLLNEYAKSRDFVKAAEKFDVDIELVSGKYVINAKSQVGIYSLDLSKPIDVIINAPAEKKAEVEKAFEPFKA